MGKPRVKLPTLASRNTVTCIDTIDVSRNPSVQTSTLHDVSHCLAPSSVEHNLRQQQQPPLSLTVTDLNAADIYRTSTPRRYEDWLPVKDHLIFILDDDSLDNWFLRQQEEQFVKLHYNFTGVRITPRWTHVPPPSSRAAPESIVEQIQYANEYEIDDEFNETVSEASYDVLTDLQTCVVHCEDPPKEQLSAIECTPQISVEVHYDVSKMIECEFEPIELTDSISCDALGSDVAFVQRGSYGLLQYYTHQRDRGFSDTTIGVHGTAVPYNYKRRRRR